MANLPGDQDVGGRDDQTHSAPQRMHTHSQPINQPTTTNGAGCGAGQVGEWVTAAGAPPQEGSPPGSPAYTTSAGDGASTQGIVDMPRMTGVWRVDRWALTSWYRQTGAVPDDATLQAIWQELVSEEPQYEEQCETSVPSVVRSAALMRPSRIASDLQLRRATSFAPGAPEIRRALPRLDRGRGRVASTIRQLFPESGTTAVGAPSVRSSLRSATSRQTWEPQEIDGNSSLSVSLPPSIPGCPRSASTTPSQQSLFGLQTSRAYDGIVYQPREQQIATDATLAQSIAEQQRQQADDARYAELEQQEEVRRAHECDSDVEYAPSLQPQQHRASPLERIHYVRGVQQASHTRDELAQRVAPSSSRPIQLRGAPSPRRPLQWQGLVHSPRHRASPPPMHVPPQQPLQPDTQPATEDQPERGTALTLQDIEAVAGALRQLQGSAEESPDRPTSGTSPQQLEEQLRQLSAQVDYMRRRADSSTTQAAMMERLASVIERLEAARETGRSEVGDLVQAFTDQVARLSSSGDAAAAPASGDSIESTRRHYSRKWAKAASEGEVDKLGKAKQPNLVTFVAWRRRVERWARLMDSSMSELSPEEIEDAAPHFLEAELLEELRSAGHLALSWQSLLGHVRQAVGLTLQIVRAALHKEVQRKSESLSAYFARFDVMREEARVSKEAAKGDLLMGLTDEGRELLGRRLEASVGEPDDVPADEALASIDYDRLATLMRRGEWMTPLQTKTKASVNHLSIIPEDSSDGGSVDSGKRSRSDRRRDSKAALRAAKADKARFDVSSQGIVASTTERAGGSGRPRVAYVRGQRAQMTPAQPGSASAEAVVSRLERHLDHAVQAERQWRGKHGADMPVFERPADALAVMAAFLASSREAHRRDAAAQQVLDDAENLVIDRVLALAQTHPSRMLQQMAVEMVPRQSRRRGDSQPLTLFDVARQFSRRVPLPKLVSIEPDVRPYLACVLIDAMARAGETLVVPADLPLSVIPRDEFNRYMLESAGRSYEAYGLLGRQVEAASGGDSTATDRKIDELTMSFKALKEVVDANLVPHGEDMDTWRIDEEVSSAPETRLQKAPRQLAIRVEEMVLSVQVSQLAATLSGIEQPRTTLEQLPAVSFQPHVVLEEPQPSIEVGVLGGASEGRGRCMPDTGAAFSLMSTAVARQYGLQVRPRHASFSVANGSSARIVGEVDCTLQVHQGLALQLQNVKVQDMGKEYLFLLGADLLRGQAGLVDEVAVVTGSRIEWHCRSRGVTYTSYVINQIGAAGSKSRLLATSGTTIAAEVEVTPPSPPGLLQIQSRFLTESDLRELDAFCQERESMYSQPLDTGAIRGLADRVHQWCMSHELPRPLRIALGRCLRRRWSAPISLSQACARLLQAAAGDDNQLRAVVQEFRIPEHYMWERPPPGWTPGGAGRGGRNGQGGGGQRA